MSAASGGRAAGRCRHGASLLIATSDNRTRTGDRALPSDDTIFAADHRFAPSGGDSRLTLRRAARAGETNRAFAGWYLAFSDISRPADRRATRTANRRRRSASGYACTGDCSARIADHDVRTADRDVHIDHFSEGNDSHSFTKRAAATARRAQSRTSSRNAFCSRSIAIGQRDERAR